MSWLIESNKWEVGLSHQFQNGHFVCDSCVVYAHDFFTGGSFGGHHWDS